MLKGVCGLRIIAFGIRVKVNRDDHGCSVVVVLLRCGKFRRSLRRNSVRGPESASAPVQQCSRGVLFSLSARALTGVPSLFAW